MHYMISLLLLFPTMIGFQLFLCVSLFNAGVAGEQTALMFQSPQDVSNEEESVRLDVSDSARIVGGELAPRDAYPVS